MCANTAKKEPFSGDFKVLVIFGSPRKNGYTARLLNAFLDGLPQNAVIDRYNCFQHPPLPCNDCRYCHSSEGCAYSDLDDFYLKLKKADLLVFAAPVYNLSFPAPMKALIDRMQIYWAARFKRNVRPPIRHAKTAILLTTCGSDSQDGGEMLERQLKPVLTILNACLTHTIHYTGSDKDRPAEMYMKQASDAAQSFFSKNYC